MGKIFKVEFSLSMQPDIKKVGDAPEEIALALEYVAKSIREGYTSGHTPSWDLSVKEE